MIEEICCITNKGKGKAAMNEWENDESEILWALYIQYIYKKLGQFFFHTYSITCLRILTGKKDPQMKLQRSPNV